MLQVYHTLLVLVFRLYVNLPEFMSVLQEPGRLSVHKIG